MRSDISGAQDPDPAPAAELARHVRAWRARLNPEGVLGSGDDWPNRRRGKHVSQDQVAALIGCTTNWYRTLEVGNFQNYSSGFLRKVAAVLNLSPDETRLLFLLVGKESPAPISRVLPADLGPVLDVQPWPAYVSNESWHLVGYNAKLLAWFPWVVQPDANVMRWVFTDPEARRQLHRWDTKWAPQMLARLRASQLRYPSNKRLHQVVTEILDSNADARRLWEDPITYFHPDGDYRSLYLPNRREPQKIQIVALEPLRAPGHRLIMLMPNATGP